MAYYLLMVSTFRRQLQYRWAHMVNNLASVGFGFIYIAIWQAVAPDALARAPGPYSHAMMVHYVALNQVLLWVCYFLPAGLGISAAIRNGAIALDMSKPLPFFGMILARESGTLVYHALFRSLPMAAIFAFVTGFPAPAQPLLAVAAVVMGGYIALCMHYLIGMSAFWTKEVRFMLWLYFTTFTVNGTSVPIDVLPDAIGQVARLLPFAAQIYYPNAIWLGTAGVEALLPGLVWSVLMTGVCLYVTNLGRRFLEVQGG